MQVQPIKPYNSVQKRPSFKAGVSRYIVENLGMELRGLAKKAQTSKAKADVVKLGHKILKKLAEIRTWDNESTRIALRLSEKPNSLTKHYVHSRFNWVIELIKPRGEYHGAMIPHQINFKTEPILKSGEDVEKSGYIKTLLGLKKEDITTAKRDVIQETARFKAGLITGDIKITKDMEYNPSLAQIISSDAERILGKDSYAEYQKTLKALLKDYKPTFDQRIDEIFKADKSTSDGLVVLGTLRNVLGQIIKSAVKDKEITEQEALELAQKFQAKIAEMSGWKSLKNLPLNWEQGLKCTDTSTNITREFQPSSIGFPITEYSWYGPSFFPKFIRVASFSEKVRKGTFLQDLTEKFLSLTQKDVLETLDKSGMKKALIKSVKDGQTYQKELFLANNPKAPNLYNGSSLTKIEANMYDFLQPEERLVFGG